MKSLELAKQMLEEAGYKVTPPEEKFTPYKGQLVEAEDDGVWYVMYFVSFDARGRPICSSRTDLLYGNTWNKIHPLSNKYIKQFKPWSERGDYNGPANTLLTSGRMQYWEYMPDNEDWLDPPIAFEPLEK